MNLPILIVPKSVACWLDEKNPSYFEREEMAHVFGVLWPVPVEGKELLILTHAYQAPGIDRTYANVNTLPEGVREKLQAISNGLTIVSSTLGFPGATTVGVWHCHPDSPKTAPSFDDVATYRASARTSKLGFWICPIASRYLSRKYTRWLLYVENMDQVIELPDANVIVEEDDKVQALDGRLKKLCEVCPEHFLSNVYPETAVARNCDLPIKAQMVEVGSTPFPWEPKPDASKWYSNAANYWKGMHWFEIFSALSFGTSILLFWITLELMRG